MIEGIVVGVVERLVDAAASRGPDDPAQRYAAATLGILRHVRDHPLHARVLVQLAARPQVVDNLLVHMHADLVAGRAAGRFSDFADEIAYDLTCGLLFVMLRRIAHGPVDDEYLPSRVQRMLQYLGVSEGEATALVAAVPPRGAPGATSSTSR